MLDQLALRADSQWLHEYQLAERVDGKLVQNSNLKFALTSGPTTPQPKGDLRNSTVRASRFTTTELFISSRPLKLLEFSGTGVGLFQSFPLAAPHRTSKRSSRWRFEQPNVWAKHRTDHCFPLQVFHTNNNTTTGIVNNNNTLQ